VDSKRVPASALSYFHHQRVSSKNSLPSPITRNVLGAPNNKCCEQENVPKKTAQSHPFSSTSYFYIPFMRTEIRVFEFSAGSVPNSVINLESDFFAFFLFQYHIWYSISHWKLPTSNGANQHSFHQVHVHQNVVQSSEKIRIIDQRLR
jgi:hypothetical protein